MSAYADPAMNGVAVTPSDTVDLATGITRGLYVGTAGNVSVKMLNGTSSATLTFIGVAAGTILPIRVTRVMSTLTTASNIIALF